ncbi:MAG: hypothetical protein JSR17_11930 [Proteobacteria bacterium]|nr:hypothetical protein [Pseudomonadota bacterium]
MENSNDVDLQIFISNLKKADFINAENILSNRDSNRWHYYFDRLTGDSLIHIAIQGLKDKLEQIDKKEEEHIKLRNKEKLEYTKYCYNLVKLMVSQSFPYHTVNKKGELPAEILVENGRNRDRARDFIKLFESRGQYLYPGRKYVTNLYLFRSSSKPHKICEIPDSDPASNKLDNASLTLHQRQCIIEMKYKNKYPYSNTSLNKKFESSNLVVLNIGFIISDNPKSDLNHKPIFITFPFKIDNFVIKAFPKPKDDRTHSESLMCDFLKEKSDLIVNMLKEKNKIIRGHKIYALVLDIHSTNEICADCQNELHNLQYKDKSKDKTDSFLERMEQALLKEGCILPQKNVCDGIKGRMIGDNCPKLKLIIRASGLNGFDNYKEGEGLPRASLVINPPHDIKIHPIKILFHLPPDRNYNDNGKSTPFADDEDNKYMKEYNKKIRKQLNYKDYPKCEQIRDFVRIFPQSKVHCANYTAFSNTGGGAQDKEDKNPQTEFNYDINSNVSEALCALNYLKV